jgi:hypothetical protein
VKGNDESAPWLIVQPDLAADDPGIGAEARLPDRMAEDHDAARSLRSLLSREGAPERRPCSQDREEVGRHLRRGHGFGLAAAGQVQARVLDERHLLEDVVLTLPVEIVGGRNGEGSHPREGCRGRRMPDPHEPRGIGIRQRLEQDRVDDAEDGGVGADAESQDGNRGQGKSRALHEEPRSVPQILPKHRHDLSRCFPRPDRNGFKSAPQFRRSNGIDEARPVPLPARPPIP